MNNEGSPHISYTGCGSNYAYLDGSSWHIEEPPGGGPLVLDADGNPHIAHNYGDDLAYSFRVGSDWETKIVDTAGPVDKVFHYKSLALDKDGYPHISYFEDFIDYIALSKFLTVDNGSLKYA